jgi:DNA replication licensing factor MCM6
LVDRFEPYLKNACKRFVMEQKPTFIADDSPNKDINVAFFNLPLSKRYPSLSLSLKFSFSDARCNSNGFAYSVLFYICFRKSVIFRLRELATAEIGKLVSVSGVVTRSSEVRPELLQGTFKCLECGNIIKNVEQQFKYTEVTILLLL